MEMFSLLPLNFHSSNDDAYDALARHLSAMKKALHTSNVQMKEVNEHTPTAYTGALDRRTSMIRSSPGPLPLGVPEGPMPFVPPYPAMFTPYGGHGQHPFDYEAEIAGRSLLFKARTKDGKPICIKFVRRYGKDVHLWCAAKGFAPKLIAYEALPGGWYMVVMDLLDELWVPLAETTKHAEGLKERIHAAISELHQAQMVHGDVREMNVMVKDNGVEFMLVDYDWAGSHGCVRYPRHVNRLGRPEDVEDGRLILTQHDELMLAMMFP
jgi:RIO1 family